MGTRKYIVTLTSEERKRLAWLVSKGQDKAYRIKHANVLLAVDENGPHFEQPRSSEGLFLPSEHGLEPLSTVCRAGFGGRVGEEKTAVPADAPQTGWPGRGPTDCVGLPPTAGRIFPLGPAATGRRTGAIGRGGEYFA